MCCGIVTLGVTAPVGSLEKFVQIAESQVGYQSIKKW